MQNWSIFSDLSKDGRVTTSPLDLLNLEKNKPPANTDAGGDNNGYDLWLVTMKLLSHKTCTDILKRCILN